MSVAAFPMAQIAIGEQVPAATKRKPPKARVIVPKADRLATPQSR